MENKNLKGRYGIEYTKVGDYYYASKKVLGHPQAIYDCVSGSGSYMPNLVLEKEKINLNKYGRARLKFLKENRKAEYTIMFVNGTLNKHLKEIQDVAEQRIDIIMEELKKKNNLTEEMKNTNQLYWVGMMNNFKNTAEEIIYKELIYV